MTPDAITAIARILAASDADLGDERETLSLLTWILPTEPGARQLERITDEARILRAGCFEVELA